MRSKNANWALLTKWLVERNEPTVTIPWSELNEIVGGLPDSAINHHAQWWYGDRPHTRAWRRAGYELVHLDLEREVTLMKATAEVLPQQDDRSSVLSLPPRQADHNQVQYSDGVGLQSIDPRSALIVLPCSKGKERGGANKSAASPSSWSKDLLLARDNLREAARVDDHLVMPAWQRYTGHFYQAAKPSLPNAVSANAKIAILSGSYGVVHPEEPIGWYDRMLKKKDWPNHLLEHALIAEAIRVGAQDVVAFAATSSPYATIIRCTKWQRAGIRRAVLVTVEGISGGNARREVPRHLGAAFNAFWSGLHEYPTGIRLEELI